MPRQAIPRQAIPLVPLPAWVWALPAVLWVALVLLAFLSGPHAQSPANPVPWWVVLLFGTALFPAALLSTMAHRDISIKGDRLEVSGALLLARKVAVDDLALDRARILDLDEHIELKPMLPLGAFSLPGLKVGHYLLRNRTRAFCLLTSRQRVLVLPLRDGKPPFLLSPEHPQALLDALVARRGTT